MKTMQNAVTLSGHIGSQIEIRELSTGKRVTRVSLATTEYYRDKNKDFQKRTEWNQLVAWDDVAVKMERTLTKGMLVIIHGKLINRQYLDRKGRVQTLSEVVVREFSHLTRTAVAGQQTAA